MIGKPEGRTIIVSDVYPLPVKGAENDVKMTEKASIFMTQIVDALEVRRKDRFMGWYHSHPFDMEAWSHCHLSSTDVGSQTAWQYGTKWWTAIVIDPLRSLYKQAPEFGAYQIYHQKNYNCPKNVCPDGTIINDEKARMQRWGISSNLYYELPISYYNSSLSSHLVSIISKSALWIKVRVLLRWFLSLLLCCCCCHGCSFFFFFSRAVFYTLVRA
jgi:COP9 signalosome complex subunit 5